MNFDQTNFLSASVSCLLFGIRTNTHAERPPTAESLTLSSPHAVAARTWKKSSPEFNAIKCSDADAALSTRRAQRGSIKRHKGTQMESETLHIAAAAAAAAAAWGFWPGSLTSTFCRRAHTRRAKQSPLSYLSACVCVCVCARIKKRWC